MEVNLQGKYSVTMINAYAPTYSAEDGKVEQFYDDIERAMAHNDSKYKSMGAFGIGERNERGIAN